MKIGKRKGKSVTWKAEQWAPSSNTDGCLNCYSTRGSITGRILKIVNTHTHTLHFFSSTPGHLARRNKQSRKIRSRDIGTEYLFVAKLLEMAQN